MEEAGYSMMTGSKEMPAIHDHMGPGSDRIDLNDDPNISLHMFTMIIRDLFFAI